MFIDKVRASTSKVIGSVGACLGTPPDVSGRERRPPCRRRRDGAPRRAALPRARVKRLEFQRVSRQVKSEKKGSTAVAAEERYVFEGQ